MSGFESLGDADTPGGVLRLWRRHDLALGLDVHEVKLGDEYLMTSLFPDSEIALAELGLAELDEVEGADVVVGGLGLGHTAAAVLDDPRVGSLLVVEAVAPLIAWHRDELVPCASQLVADPRCRLQHGDFFAMAASDEGFDPEAPGRTFDALLVDIDHTPEHHLDDGRGDFYRPVGLARMARHLRPRGVFALWSDGPPLERFTAVLEEVFDDVHAEVVTFDNVVTGGTSSATIYLARRRAAGG